jgi:hypothetical protein
MSPQAALDYQIERYREMSGEERLAIALDLHELSCDVAREGIRAQHPDADESEVERLLHNRICAARNFGGDTAVKRLFSREIKPKQT